MKILVWIYFKLAASCAILVLFIACGVSDIKPEGSVDVRNKLTLLQSDPLLSSRAQLAIKEAEAATRIAEQPEKNKTLAMHRVYMADRKVDIAIALAQSRLLEDQREDLKAQRELAQLDSRTREADRARNSARTASEAAKLAQSEMMDAKQHSAELEKQLIELNAEKTDRGMVLTLGDMLFETGRSELKSGTISNLDKLSSFLHQYQDRELVIEGYTDSVGSEIYNISLSQQRAEAVKTYLVKKGISTNRMSTSGKGETMPVASNESSDGRRQNRRVEIVLPEGS